MSSNDGELLLSVDHVKYRTSDAGKSPIGTVLVMKEYVEWRDVGGTIVKKISFSDIKGQRVSPPHKPKVQLQICMQNDDQATFVFMRPGADKEGLQKDRDLLKETLQQALLAHRQRIQQLISNAESSSRSTELDAKKLILRQSQALADLYKHLVSSKLISAQDFWKDHYKHTGVSEDKMGMAGSFLANVAQSDSDGIKLNLSTHIIQNIFSTYPMVERKHLELVPHVMSEGDFWAKFATSHYFHREREVLPNPDDPFADCVKQDEAEMDKMVGEGVKRRRFDFGYLDDKTLGLQSKPETSGRGAQNTTLIRRCNFLSEKILATQLATAENGSTTVNVAANGASSTENGSSSAGHPSGPRNTGGYAALHRFIGQDEEVHLESADLATHHTNFLTHAIKMEHNQRQRRTLPREEADRLHATMHSFLHNVQLENVLTAVDAWRGSSSMKTGGREELEPATQWGDLAPSIHHITLVHNAVSELAKHFWTCFPPKTAELEAKVERMMGTITTYEETVLLEAEHQFGQPATAHCRFMLAKVHEKFKAYMMRKRK